MDGIYARQSLDVKESLSIEGQIELCRRYAGEDVLVFQDKGFSGKNTNRPAFQELMEKVRAGEISKILVYRLDRFSRSIADFSQIWVELERLGVEFVSVTEQFDTSSPMGRAMLNIVLTFAQLERETTAQRVKDNYRHRVDLGAWPGGPAPFGFDLAKTTDDQGRTISTLIPNGSAEMVREIYQLYTEPGVSLRGLAKDLTSRGILGPRRNSWDNVSLSRMLHNPVYVQADAEVCLFYLTQGVQVVQPPEAFDGSHGCILIGKRDRGKGRTNGAEAQRLSLASHPGIVPSDLWLAVQDKLAGNRQLDRSMAGKYSWLTGLLKCGSCGYALRINYDRRAHKYYLLCSGRSNYGVCDASIRVDLRELESVVEAALAEVLDQCPVEEVHPADDPTARELEETEQKIGRLVMALAESSEVSALYISAQIDRLHKRKQELEAKLSQRKKHPSQRCRIDIHGAGFEEKQIIAAEFIRRIEVVGERVNIVWNM